MPQAPADEQNLSSETLRSVKGISFNMIFKILGFLGAFFFQIYYVRVLGPRNWGNLSLAMSIFTFANAFALIGQDTALTRFLPGFRDDKEFPGKMAAYLGYTLRQSSLVGIILIALICIYRNNLSNLISPKENISLYIVLLSPLLLISLWGQLAGGALRAWERFGEYSFANDFLPRFSRGSAFLSSYLLIGHGVFSFFIALFMEGVLRLGCLMKFLGKRVVREMLHPANPLNSTERKSVTVFGSKVVLYSLLATSMTELVRLLLGYFGDNTGVGIYAVAETLALIMIFIQSSLGTVFTPQVARLYQSNQTQTMINLYRRLSRWAIVCTLPYALTLILNAKEIMSLYGGDFSSGYKPLVVLITAQFIAVSLGLNGTVLYMSGRENIVIAGQILHTALTAILCWFLIPSHGLLGAALATGLSLLAMNIVFLVSFFACFGTTQFSLNMAKTALAGVSLGLILYIFIMPINLGFIVLNVLVKIGLSYVIFFLLLSIVDRREEDREVILAVWGRLGRSLRQRGIPL